MENPPHTPPPSQPLKRRNPVTSLLVGAIGLGSGLYLCFPGSLALRAVVEFIPVVGQFDEAAAAALLFSCLAYFGLDLTHLFGRSKEYEKREKKPDSAKQTIDAEFVES